MTIDQQFNSLNDKLQQLLKQHSRLQKEAEKLREELAEARNKQSQIQERVEELEQQASILKLATGDMSEKDKREFERKINQYVREVDKCISFLSQ
jgi:chromosome segregation ATPase